MYQFDKAVVVILAAIGFSIINPTYDNAQAGADGDYRRHHQCRQLRQSGQLKWYSIASGIVDDGSGRNGYGGFHTKACHTNENSCRRWIQNIAYEIPNLDTVRTAYCQPVH